MTQTALGTALLATQGFTAPAVAQAYRPGPGVVSADG